MGSQIAEELSWEMRRHAFLLSIAHADTQLRAVRHSASQPSWQRGSLNGEESSMTSRQLSGERTVSRRRCGHRNCSYRMRELGTSRLLLGMAIQAVSSEPAWYWAITFKCKQRSSQRAVKTLASFEQRAFMLVFFWGNVRPLKAFLSVLGSRIWISLSEQFQVKIILIFDTWS